MIYRYIKPSLPLRHYVKDYVLAHLIIDSNSIVPNKPFPAKPEEGFTFYIRSFLTASDAEMNTVERRAGTQIVGQQVYRQNFRFSHEYLMFNVQLQPGALFKLLRIPMTELINKNLDAELLLGQEIRDINDQLANTFTYDGIFHIVEGFLIKKIQNVKENFHPVDKIGQMILENPFDFNLDYLANQACLSPSQLERRFMQQVGVTPKFFTRMCRFQEAFKLKKRFPNLSWLDIAWQTSYTDYQHLVKDCKQFTSTTPNLLMQEEDQSPAQMLGINLEYYK
jgi:AraC-like DNA-binding protein